MDLKWFRHALSVIGLVVLIPSLPLAQTSYLRLEVLMDTDVHRLAARIPGQAAIRWKNIAPHPSLPEDRARIALVALLYGRILFAHEETRVELFHRVGQAATRIVKSDAAFNTESWDLQAGGISFPIWPWRLVGPNELKSAKTYVATLIGNDSEEDLAILLDMAPGLERILAPASVLVALSALSQELAKGSRLLLGQVLLEMNNHYGMPENASRLGSGLAAFRAALPLLLARSVEQKKQELIVNKQDTDRIFGLNLSGWNTYAKEFVHPEGWKMQLSLFETGTRVVAFDPTTGNALSVQPFFSGAQGPPDMLIVGSYYRVGTFMGLTDQLKRDMETAAQSDLGPSYSVRISFARMASPPPGLDVVEVIITPVKR
jgi:hypothetical protein